VKPVASSMSAKERRKAEEGRGRQGPKQKRAPRNAAPQGTPPSRRGARSAWRCAHTLEATMGLGKADPSSRLGLSGKAGAHT
jgi:hypothetical protein